MQNLALEHSHFAAIETANIVFFVMFDMSMLGGKSWRKQIWPLTVSTWSVSSACVLTSMSTCPQILKTEDVTFQGRLSILSNAVTSWTWQAGLKHFEHLDFGSCTIPVVPTAHQKRRSNSASPNHIRCLTAHLCSEQNT